MIDIENEVYTIISDALEAEFPGVYVTGEVMNAPSEFPCVSVVESDNYTAINRLDSSDHERFGVLMYEINVYSDKTHGSKSECRAIMRLIDSKFFSLNFTRLVLTPVPNLYNASVYRLTARYRAETDGTNIYRR